MRLSLSYLAHNKVPVCDDPSHNTSLHFCRFRELRPGTALSQVQFPGELSWNGLGKLDI